MVHRCSSRCPAARRCSTPAGTCTPVGVELLDDARKKAVVADIAFGGGVLFAATAVALRVTAPRRTSATATRLVPTTRGVAVVGSF